MPCAVYPLLVTLIPTSFSITSFVLVANLIFLNTAPSLKSDSSLARTMVFGVRIMMLFMLWAYLSQKMMAAIMAVLPPPVTMFRRLFLFWSISYA